MTALRLRLDTAMNGDTTLTAPACNVRLRPFRAIDLEAAQALSAELQWPHRPEDWRFALSHGAGVVAEREGRLVGAALRWLWGTDRATFGLVIVSPGLQGQGIGRRLMAALLRCWRRPKTEPLLRVADPKLSQVFNGSARVYDLT